MRISATILSIGAVAAMGLWTAYGQEAGSNAMVQPSGMEFMKQAAQGNETEIKLGELAQKRGHSEAVKQYGKMLAEDHRKANRELKDLAAQTSVKLPEKPNSEEQSTFDRLSKLSGQEFDKEFIQTMIQDHQKDIGEFQTEANSNDTHVAQFAQKVLPTLNKHLQKAQQIQSELNK